MGLSEPEYDRAAAVLGRRPNATELAIFAAMWSEHCSYKSSRKLLATLPAAGPQVIQGPGENAGAVAIGDGRAAVFKIESHNHPSFIEPRQGAATGVGGILRDIFAMGARPVAGLNALRFGSPGHPRTRHLVRGVVAGIGGYGNCVGVPTVAGETGFDSGYDSNILVNAMTVGIADSDRIFYARGAAPGLPVVYAGSRTGRDGIDGATMASTGFSGDAGEKRPTVQVGDPFAGKLLMEACLELMATDAAVAVQDLGAAGLTSASVELAARGGSGIELDLDAVPRRESAMTARELMLSESQERMLMVLQPHAVAAARGIFAKWELECAVIGRTTGDRRLVLREGGTIAADIPVPPLVEEAPEYDRPREATPPPPVLAAAAVAARDPADALLALVASPDGASRRWLWEQYDRTVMADTVAGPGGDAAIVRIDGGNRGLAMTCDCTPRYVAADPVTGGRQAVAEAWRNLSAAGARPLAFTNSLNFGNPERPRVMGQLAGAVAGMAEAAAALDFPVVSGNVSLYNETGGRDIPPTPVVGGVGIIDDLDRRAGIALAEGHDLVLVGATGGWLGCSLYCREILDRRDGAPPPVDLAAERAAGDLVRGWIGAGRVAACHDISDGGLAVAAAEMAMAGGTGAALDAVDGIPVHAWLFGEDQGRYLVATAGAAGLLAEARDAGVAAQVIGRAGGGELTLPGAGPISVARLRDAHEGWLPSWMAAG